MPSIRSMLPSMPSYFKTPSDKEILDLIKSTDDFIRNRTQILKMNQGSKDYRGRTPLHLAARYHPESIGELLQAGANLNIQDRDGFTPLFYAGMFNRQEYTGMLLQAGANPNIQTRNGSTALHHFCIHSQPKIVEELLQAGADPNIETQSGDTPLSLAARYHPESLEKLLQAGANPNPNLPLHVVKQYKPALHVAVQYKPESVEKLLQAGANPNTRDWYGRTPLHVAALNNAPKEVFEKLIAYGAKIDLCNYTGKTFLEDAKDPDSYKDLEKVVIPTMREGTFCLRNEKGLIEEDLNLIYEQSTGNLYQNEGMVKWAAKSMIVFGATPFFVVGAMLQRLIRSITDIASLFFNSGAIFKAEGTRAMVKSIVLGIPKAILDRVWEAIEMPLDGLATMGYALYGLYNGNEARCRMNQTWGEGYLLKLSGMAPIGNLRDTVEGKTKFYTKELKN